MEQSTLYYRQGSSDKVYRAEILSADGGYAVQFAYGRRGTTLQTGTKTQRPVSHEEAKKIFDKLVAEKKAKGYTPGETGIPYQETGKEQQVTGILPQLLNPVDDAELRRLIVDPGWWMQEKLDGRRLLIRKDGDAITGINRLGLSVAVPETIEQGARVLARSFILDGEAVGDTLYAFDLLQIKDQDVRERTYSERYLTLMNLLASHEQSSIKLVPTAFMPEQKKALLDQLKAESKEGVVFKRLDAPYMAGRPSSGGTQLKSKFCETASFIVDKVNLKRSVALSLLDDAKSVQVGNVTIPPNHEIPRVGQVVEVRYLYAFRGGSIYQPVYLGQRDDIEGDECVISQLKFKAETEAAA
jgi:bifunctional non-homologous end joining protein LigD